MNKPIINPLWIYVSDVIPSIGEMLGALFIIGIITSFVLSIIALILDDDEAWKYVIENILKKWWLLIVIATISNFIPSRETMRAMMIANYVTPANIESVGNGEKDVVDYIFEKINESEGKDEK